MRGRNALATRTLTVVITVALVGNAALVGIGTASGATQGQSETPGLTSVGSAAERALASDYCDLEGDTETATEPGKVGDVRVEKPVAIEGVEHPRQTAREFAAVTKLFNLTDSRQDTVVGIVPPSEARAAGWAGSGDEYVCLSGKQGYLWDGLMAHEYVHSRQEFSVSSNMEWFVESSAYYYMAVVPYQRGTMSERRANARLSEPPRKDNSSDVRALTLTWTRDDYDVWLTRGTAVLAALDHEIRERTAGRRTLEHVFQAMTAEGQTITYGKFRAIVADVTGERMHDWLDRYVDGSDVVSQDQSRVEGLTLTSTAASSNLRVTQVNSLGGDVAKPNPDSFDVTVTEGGPSVVFANVENNGTVKTRQRIRLLTDAPDGERKTLDEVNRTVAPGGETNVSLFADPVTELEPGTYEIRLATDDDEVRGTVTVEATETPTAMPETDEPVSNAEVNGGSQRDRSPRQQPPALSKIFEFPYSAYAVGVFVVVMWLRYLNR